MEQPGLYKILEYIMNAATEQEIHVIITAIKRRLQDNKSSVLSGLNTKQMSKQVAEDIRKQLSTPVANIRKMIREMVVKMIKQSVPDIPREHLDVLLNQWVPEPGQAPVRETALPPEVLLTMVKHFIKYSTGVMTPGEQIALKKAMPDWHNAYWEQFPGPVRGLISKYLNGEIQGDLFWQALKQACSPG